MKKMNYFMTIAASDNSGGAGIQQDLKVAEKFGFWGLSVVTGITVQDFSGLDTIFPLPLDLIKAQFLKNINSFKVDAIKIGALCSPEITKLITELLRDHYQGIVIVDPVLAPTKGKSFIANTEIAVYKDLLKQASIVTPNKQELEQLTLGHADNYPQALSLAHNLIQETNCSVYVKGGHFTSPQSDEIKEYFVTLENEYFLTKPKKDFSYSHGTGCFFASALACSLVKYQDELKACKEATEAVSLFYSDLNQN